MRVLVTAWRRYPNNYSAQIHVPLRQIYKMVVDGWGPLRLIVVHGDAPGGDAIASRWAQAQGRIDAWVTQEPYPADWQGLGRAAGPARNRAMVKLGADICVAFPGPDYSPGTRGCIELAQAAGIPTWVHEWGRPAPTMPDLPPPPR